MGDCNDKPVSLTISARISRGFQTPQNLPLSKLKTSGIIPRRVEVRSCKYLNNVIEQDHRRIKQRVRPMLGFKRFETAALTIRGIELAEKIKKQQFNLKPLTGQATTAPGIWTAVLAA